MARGVGTTLGFPPFTRGVKVLIFANVAVYLTMLLLRLTVPSLVSYAGLFFYLSPVAVLHGELWQLVTYAFFHAGIGHILFNMLGLWMFGSQFEMDFGSRRFYEFYFWCVVGAGLTTIVVGAVGLLSVQLLPAMPLSHILASVWFTSTLGASGGVYGFLLAFGMLHGDQEIYLFPIPIGIRARYFVAILMLVIFVEAFSGSSNGVAEFAHLGGALFAWIYLRYVPRYGLQTATSESMFGIRNRYYKWKRRRAAKKFEVYMRKNQRGGYFDEQGNFHRPPMDDNDDDSKWVH
jgi:membrane associated rhomboid family serine protease